jgi:hypothetical protein
MPEAHSSTSDFNRAFGDAKKQAANVAGEVSDAAQDLYDHASERASRLGDASTTPRARPPDRLRRRCAIRSKTSLTPPSPLRSAWDGCWAACTDRFDRRAPRWSLPQRQAIWRAG